MQSDGDCIWNATTGLNAFLHRHLITLSHHQWQRAIKVTSAPYLRSDLVGSLESTVVSDVLSQGVSSIQRLLVDAVVSILLHHALGLLLKGLHWRVFPPGTQVSILVVFPPFKKTMVWNNAVCAHYRQDLLNGSSSLSEMKIFDQPWSSKAWVSSCPITTPIPPKLRALKTKHRKCTPNVQTGFWVVVTRWSLVISVGYD